MLYVFVFFFSSRRRHTSWPRDWSSDVCSSDLIARHVACDAAKATCRAIPQPAGKVSVDPAWSAASNQRSEERRVGKECRPRWTRYPYTEQDGLRSWRLTCDVAESHQTPACDPR